MHLSEIVQSLLGVASIGAAIVLLVARTQLKATERKVKAELLHVRVCDGHLVPDQDQTMTGVLRGGFVQRRNRKTGLDDVVTAYVFSDDALS